MSDPLSSNHQLHELKCAREFFDAVESGQKPFEICVDDRPFEVGHTLHLREVDLLLRYTGRETRKLITFILRRWGINHGYVGLGLASMQPQKCLSGCIAKGEPDYERPVHGYVAQRDPKAPVPQRPCTKCGQPCNVEVCAKCARTSNQRVRLLNDIYDDGADHHPPGYIARKGEVLVVRTVRSLGVSHEGVENRQFAVREGEFELIPPVETSDRPPMRTGLEAGFVTLCKPQGMSPALFADRVLRIAAQLTGDPYKAACQGGSGGKCTDPDCEKCWPEEPTPPHPGPSIERAFANSPRRVPEKATREDVFECPATRATCKQYCQYGNCAIQGSENGKPGHE